MQTECKIHLQESKQQLTQGKLKITKARIMLLDILKHSKKPLSIKEISKQVPKVDLVTLYRNIKSLIQLNLVKEINFKNGQAYFEIQSNDHHHHLVCSSCGRITDIKVQEFNLSKPVLNNYGFAYITDHSLEFFGICKTCAL